MCGDEFQHIQNFKIWIHRVLDMSKKVKNIIFFIIVLFCLLVILLGRDIVLICRIAEFKYKIFANTIEKYDFPYYAINLVSDNDKIKYLLQTNDLSLLLYIIECQDKELNNILDIIIISSSDKNMVFMAKCGKTWSEKNWQGKTKIDFLDYFAAQKKNVNVHKLGEEY